MYYKNSIFEKFEENIEKTCTILNKIKKNFEQILRIFWTNFDKI